MYPYGLGAVVDAIEDAVWATASTVLAGNVAAQWFADSTGFSGQVTNPQRGQAAVVTD